MKLGVVCAMLINNPELMRLTTQWADSVVSKADTCIYAIVNGLKAYSITDLTRRLSKDGRGLKMSEDKDRSVSSSWNLGIATAIRDGCDYIAICGNDTVPEPTTLDRLIEFGEDPCNKNVSVWSGATVMHGRTEEVNRDACDFSFFMLRPWTVVRHGTFDENLVPAYFEDNDMYARIILGGGECAAVHSARFFHYGSMTTRTDPEYGKRLQQLFTRNRRYFQQKWGVENPAKCAADVLSGYYKTPWNSEDKDINWWPPR